MNRFPIWKYLLIALVLITSAIYTLPNFFGERRRCRFPAADNPFRWTRH